MCMHQIVVAKRIISIHWHQQNWKNYTKKKKNYKNHKNIHCVNLPNQFIKTTILVQEKVDIIGIACANKESHI